METSLLTIGSDIKSYRIQAGMSQEQLSVLSGVERSQLSRIESGEVLGVTYATIEKILNSLGRTIQHVKIEEKEEKLDVHPFVKWAGGKTQLLDVIESHLPEKFNRYFEPFVGGGALLFKIQPKSFSINDMNSELISVYQCFQNDGLFNSLKDKLINHENNHSEEYYYQVREQDKNPLFAAFPLDDRASRMIYLNKSCFNGLYRVNSKGYFNVPSGKKEKVNCFDRDNFELLRKFFKTHKSVITNCDFEEAVKNAKAGDFVYFDPPYDTWDDKDSFTSYDKNAFGKDEQKRLAKVYKQLSDKGVYVMLSNHNTNFIRELYADFHINVVPAKRMINANGNGRGSVEEVLITNYE
ncbi:MAG: Dam family site-specific DNA-(adenine-N6)-methyltransferase [Bacilli bacterium]|nr:Dam family site-specific DNA-(adenine-N6)-methyltransferase [Bacilli bacterium]